MRVLIATPAGGGVVTVQYLLSYLDTMYTSMRKNTEKVQAAQAKGIPPDPKEILEIGLYTLANESLLPRGRNHCAQVALTQGWDKLFFIDADAGWNYDQFAKVATSRYPISAGACPLKMYPISLNYLPFQDDEHYYKDAIRSVESMEAMRDGHKKVEIPVAFVGTAFLCVDVSVLRRLAETTPPYQYPNPYTGNPETHWDFFNCAPVDKQYMSEDWGFCNLARKNGYDIMLNTEVLITHTGSHTFHAVLKPNQVMGPQSGQLDVPGTLGEIKPPTEWKPTVVPPEIPTSVEQIPDPIQTANENSQTANQEVQDVASPVQTSNLQAP